MSSEKLEPSDEARELAVDIATRIYFECDTLHEGQGSLDCEYDRIAADIDGLVRTSLSACEAKLAASEKRCVELEAIALEAERLLPSMAFRNVDTGTIGPMLAAARSRAEGGA
jgi:hypothetical protein